MKKIILSLAIISAGTFATSTTYAQMLSPASTSVTAPKQEEKSTLPDPPKFASDDANKGMADLVSLFKEYAPAIRAKDTAKLMEFTGKIQAMQQKMSTWVMALSPEEQQTFQKYMQDLGKAIVGKQAETDTPPAKVQ